MTTAVETRKLEADQPAAKSTLPALSELLELLSEARVEIKNLAGDGNVVVGRIVEMERRLSQ